jgi:hypothetical protein
MKWSEKKNPFKVGDRVLLALNELLKATITETDDSPYIRVRVDGGEHAYLHHWRQCKKLVKKKREYPKDVWVTTYKNGDISIHKTLKESNDEYLTNPKPVKNQIRYVPAKDQKK